MRGLASRLVVAGAALAASLALAAPALGAPAISGHFALTESEIGTNNKIIEGPDGNIWVTTANAAKPVARVTPAGATQEFETGNAKTWSGITVGPDLNLWATFAGGVARFSPADPKGTFKEFPLPAIKAEASIVTGPDGNMWVATDGSIVRFSSTNPAGTEKAFPIAKLSPKDIDVAGAGLVVADFEPRILTLTTSGAVSKEYPIDGGSQGVAGGANGLIGFSQQGSMPEQVGLISPPSNPQVFTQEGDPFGVAYGSDAAFWVVRSGVDGVARMSVTGQITQLSGFPAGSMPRQITSGPGNTMWVTLTNPGKVGEIGRVSGLEPPVPPSPGSSPQPGPVPPGPAPIVLPQTTLGKGLKKVVNTTGQTANVKISFSSTTAGAKFECSVGKRVKPKGKTARFVGKGFKGCKSPKTYTLQPGRYRFQVRSVSGSLRDSSPAQYNFKVIHVAQK